MKELRFGNELAPSNIRIHGTMYRRIRSLEDRTPVRYLLVEPAERTATAASLGLRPAILKAREKEILPHNAHMRSLQRWAKSADFTKDLRLERQEASGEVAAVMDETFDGRKTPPAVVFRNRASKQPGYICTCANE